MNNIAFDAPKFAWRGLKSLLRPLKRTLIKRVERAANPYATHIPVLIGLGRALDVKRVLEFGCGEYSTLTFLDRSAFPHLMELKSLETDAEWLNRVTKLAGGDSRAALERVRGAMSSAAASVELDKYDLAFIDDSTSEMERAATIRVVAAKRAASTVVVIHDYEMQAYQQAAGAFTNQFIFNAQNPHTGVVWNNAFVDKKTLKRLRLLIKRHSKHLEPDDIGSWIHVLTL